MSPENKAFGQTGYFGAVVFRIISKGMLLSSSYNHVQNH